MIGPSENGLLIIDTAAAAAAAPAEAEAEVEPDTAMFVSYPHSTLHTSRRLVNPQPPVAIITHKDKQKVKQARRKNEAEGRNQVL